MYEYDQSNLQNIVKLYTLKTIIQYVFPRKVMLFLSLRNPFSSGTD